MSRLLVIEPNRMLRYGLAVALTPDHLPQFADTLPEAAALKNVDGVIVDAATLRQGAQANAVEINTVDGWRVPTVWIDDREPTSPPDRVDWVTVQIPVQRERLLKALFDCFNPAIGSPAAARKFESSAAPPAKTRAKKTKRADAPASASANVIELVEVVEDAPENG